MHYLCDTTTTRNVVTMLWSFKKVLGGARQSIYFAWPHQFIMPAGRPTS